MIQSRTIVPAAKDLHKQLYTAFAEGDVATLKDITGETLLDTFRSRLSQRQPHERVLWELVKYKGWTRKVMHVTVPYPMNVGGLPVGLQQAIVKIRSVQRMKTGTVSQAKTMGAKPVATTADTNTEVVWGESKEKTVTEYVVIQRQLVKGKQEPWHIWGFAKEFDIKELANAKAQKVEETVEKKSQLVPERVRV
jgi:protein MBA1